MALRVVLVVMLAACLVYSAVSIAQYYIASRGTETAVDELRNNLASASLPPTATAAATKTPAQAPEITPETTIEAPAEATPTARVYQVSERFYELYLQNSDLAGWLSIDGTHIDYPVMLSPEDEQFYINHNFEKERDDNGLPFLDERCVIAPKSQIQIIYGHNIKSGIMFHNLMLYSSESFWKEHQFISYDTLYDQAAYQIVAAFVFDASTASSDGFQFHRFTEFPTESVFEAYKKEVLALSLYDTGLDFAYGDQYLILATCEYSTGDGRFVLLAKQVS